MEQFKGKHPLWYQLHVRLTDGHWSRITVVNSDISQSTVVGVSCAIIVLVFLIQPFGTGKIANTFAPIVILWMFFNLSFGIYVRDCRLLFL